MAADELLAAAIEAHGGAARWAAVDEVVFRARAGGVALATKTRPGLYRSAEFHVSTRRPRVVVTGWLDGVGRGVYEPDRVWIEDDEGAVVAERRDPRAAFRGRRHLWWDRLDLLHFAGYAWWGYANAPFAFAQPGFEVRELEPWHDRGEARRRLAVRFPPDVPAHSREQVFHLDDAFRIRRNDYTAEVFGPWARAAHLVDGHREFDGVLVPTHRRVHWRAPGGRPLRFPTLIRLDVDGVRALRAAREP